MRCQARCTLNFNGSKLLQTNVLSAWRLHTDVFHASIRAGLCRVKIGNLKIGVTV